MAIVARSEWDAEPPTKVTPMQDSSLGWIVHYNGPALPEHLSGAQVMQSVQRYHKHTLGWRDFAYSFGIDQDGVVYTGRGWFVVGGHTSGRFLGLKSNPSNNSHAHAVFFMLGQGQVPSQAALDAFAWLVAQGVKKGVPARTTPHKVAAPGLGTACPGPELTAITKSGYFLDTNKEEGIAMKETVRQLYLSLLGREPDEAGWDYWTKQLNEQATTLDYVRWQFVAAALAAERAATVALAAKVDAGNAGQSAVLVTDRAFQDFLTDLITAAQDARH